ncbi:MAG: DinB family protein [Thermaerobacter sp.]|nr:DinB family protein [Thermaerobacter sp.]MDA8145812.1 DinB family protein [Thermaerobacter sp.]
MDGFFLRHRRVRRATLKLIRSLDEEWADFRPTPGLPTVLGLLRHLAQAERSFVSAATGGDWTSPPEPDCLDRVHRQLERQGEEAEHRLRGASPDEEAGLLLELMLEHELHHAGQLTVYLRLGGMAPPREGYKLSR